MNSRSIKDVPSYGVLKQNIVASAVDRTVEEIINIGFSVIHSGLSTDDIQSVASNFDSLHSRYRHMYGESYLKSIDEHNGIRLPLAFDIGFVKLATNANVLNVIAQLIIGKFILNQQNGIINPAGQQYNQGAWHRDLPYQHFVSSRPIIVNALYCVDDFTLENGATYVIPGSHKNEAFPSDAYVLKNAIQLVAPAGSFAILDGMTFHRGGNNNSLKNRRAVNHVYTIPHIKQQIDIPTTLCEEDIGPVAKELFEYAYRMPRSAEEFLKIKNV